MSPPAADLSQQVPCTPPDSEGSISQPLSTIAIHLLTLVCEMGDLKS